MEEQGGRVPKKSLTSTSEIKASKSNVVQQAKLMDSAGTAWHAVKYGSVEAVTKLFPSTCNVYAKGPVGETCFHIALLLNTPSTLAIAKYLVKLYGKTLVNTPYQERKHQFDEPGLYEGETALHICIVNRDFEMVKFLIQSGADIFARCYGGFFQPGGVVYYGEYPLSFAASTGQKDIVSYLKRHGAQVNQDRDMYGNTALHMATWHNQIEMYEHLVEYCGASEHVRNNRGQTPLLLAASLGKLEMFQHIYNRRRKVAWAYGPVTSYSLSLYEIDTVQSSSRNFVPSTVETIVRKGHMHMIDDPLVKTLLTSKWSRFAAAQFILQALCHIVLVIVQTFLIWLHCDPDHFNSYHREALEICSLILAAGFFVLEVADFVKWTEGVYNRRRLMKANAKYCPSLYPIPGEVQEEPKVKVKGGLWGSKKQQGGGGAGGGGGSSGAPVAEGWQQQPQAEQELAHISIHPTSPGSVVWQGGHIPEGYDLGSGAASGEEGSSSSHELDQQQHSLHSRAGPVCEGRDQQAKSSVQFQQIDDSELTQRAKSVSSTPVQQKMQAPMQKVLSMQTRPLNKSQSAAASRAAPVDIVSVGLSAPAQGAPSMLSQAPSFFMPPPATSMLGLGQGESGAATPGSLAHGGPLPGKPSLGGPGAASMGRGGASLAAAAAAGVMSSPQVLGAGPPALTLDHSRTSGGAYQPGSVARESWEASLPSPAGGGTEIKNRLRGGGGSDLPSGTQAMRRESKKVRAQEREELDADDDREPLFTGGLAGHMGALRHSLTGYCARKLADPITLLLATHILLTLIHFITWASSYGGVGGGGPSNPKARQFDDIIISAMALSGWIATLYYARVTEYSGVLAVIIELCCWEVLKFCSIYFVFNIGFTLAFYAILNGTTDVVPTDGNQGVDVTGFAVPHPFMNIGFGMMQLLRFLYGEAEYDTYTATPFQAKRAIATIYFILYIAVTLLLLVNLITAMILHVFKGQQTYAKRVWLLRWASFVLRAEARMPLGMQQKYRLGEVSFDPNLQARVYNHVFEVVDEDKGDETRDKEAKALEAALERLRKGGNKK